MVSPARRKIGVVTGVRVRERDSSGALRCAWCHDALAGRRRADEQGCAGCGALHHDACWTEAGACATCGAGRERVERSPPVERSSPIELVGVAMFAFFATIPFSASCRTRTSRGGRTRS